MYGNKYFKGEEMECKIVLKAKLHFSVDVDTIDGLWDNFGRSFDHVWAVAETILRVNGLEVFEFVSITDNLEGDMVTLTISKVRFPDPEIMNCKTSGCPYTNYFGVCRNCEDDAPVPTNLIDYHNETVVDFKQKIRDLEKKVLTLTERTYVEYIGNAWDGDDLIDAELFLNPVNPV